MNEQAKIARANVDSLVEWWKMAGVDYLVNETPQSWLDQQDEPAPVAVQPIDTEKSPVSPEPMAVGAPIAAPTQTEITPIQPKEWPQNLELLKTAIASGENLPGNSFGGKSVAPIGDANANLMIISDLPSAEDVETRQLSSGTVGSLLEKMIAAMGQEIGSNCYLTALATTRPAIGEIPDGTHGDLAAFIMHQMQLVKPKAVLILGTAACQALLNAELMTARRNLHYFNHDGQKVTALTTFHPRTLLARPILKAQAWKDLQMLMKKGAL